MKLQLEINKNALNDPSAALLEFGILMTPMNLDQDFWFFRVMVSDKQAVVGFPKFGIIGVGFMVEDSDWNTNLPADCDAREIYDHIEENKGDDSIPDDRCIEAIRLIQDAVKAMKTKGVALPS